MLVDIKLNGKSVKADITADMTLYEFVREHGCYSVNVAVKHLTVAYVQYFLMISLSFHVQFLQQEQTNAVLQHSKDYRRRRLNLSHL